MTSRRLFLAGTFSLLSAAALPALADAIEAFKGEDIFERILRKALAGNWASLPIGQTMGKIAMELKGTPYVGFTLELSKDEEICSVNLTGLDCVTFFEDTLDFARMLKTGGKTPAAMLEQVKWTRYRGGVVGDFTSRLHYTTDWFFDNQKKGVVKVLTDLPGTQPFTQKVGIMSEKPQQYRQLAAHPDLIARISEYESEINARNPQVMKYVPLAALPEAEKQLQTGDIVGVCTTQEGIDIAHTGLIYKDEQGVPHFMDASSSKKNMKVTLEPGPISHALTWSKKLSGAIFARPLEPKA